MPALGLAEGELARGRVLRPGVWHVRSIHQPQVRSSGDGPDGYRVLDEAPLADFCMRAKGYSRSAATPDSRIATVTPLPAIPSCHERFARTTRG